MSSEYPKGEFTTLRRRKGGRDIVSTITGIASGDFVGTKVTGTDNSPQYAGNGNVGTLRLVDPHPSAADSEQQLSKAQRLTAQIVFSGIVLDTLIASARQELPGLRSRSIYRGNNSEQHPSDKDIVVHRVSGMLNAYSLYSEQKAGIDNKDKIEQFRKDENGQELLDRASTLFTALEPTRDEIFQGMAAKGPWRQRGKRILTKVKARAKLGPDRDLLYRLTDTTMDEEKAKSKAWVKTVATTAALEAIPHLGGAATVVADLPKHLAEVIPGIDSTPGRIVTAVALNVAMQYLIFGPNTKENTDMVMDGGTSITIPAKVMHETASEYADGDEERARKRAVLGHRLNQGAWEILYGAEALVIGISTGAIPALDYWAGSAAVGLVKNVGLYAGFKGRKGIKRYQAWRNAKNTNEITHNDEPISTVLSSVSTAGGDLKEGAEIRLK